MLLYSIIFGGALIAAVIACINFAKKKVPLFFILILLGMLTFCLGRFFEFLQVFLFNQLLSSFHVGKLSMIGGNLFIFTAYFGAMDKMLDDGAEENKKYRLIAIIMPAVFLISFLIIPVILKCHIAEYAASLCVCLSGLPAAYYCFKFLIFPVDDMMMIKKLKGFNVFTLLMVFLTNVELVSILGMVYNQYYALSWFFADILLAIVYILSMIFLARGYKKWTVLC